MFKQCFNNLSPNTFICVSVCMHFKNRDSIYNALSMFGHILEFKHFPDKNNCFVKYQDKEEACFAIVSTNQELFQESKIATTWGDMNEELEPHFGTKRLTVMI